MAESGAAAIDSAASERGSGVLADGDAALRELATAIRFFAVRFFATAPYPYARPILRQNAGSV
jgi:hypothetical protein